MSRDYTKLHVFQLADELALEVYALSGTLPGSERFGLQAQLRRAAVSVPANIVEGSTRRTDRAYLTYLETSLGSACEVRYLLQLCARLGLLKEATHRHSKSGTAYSSGSCNRWLPRSQQRPIADSREPNAVSREPNAESREPMRVDSR